MTSRKTTTWLAILILVYIVAWFVLGLDKLAERNEDRKYQPRRFVIVPVGDFVVQGCTVSNNVMITFDDKAEIGILNELSGVIDCSIPPKNKEKR